MKKILIILCSLLLAMTIAGCGVSRVPNNKHLQEMLVAKYPECLQLDIHNDEFFEIDDFEIIRRQTNKETKVDDVDCKVTMSNENYEVILNYKLHLNFYDEGGWQLDGYELLDGEEIKVKNNTLPDAVKESEMDGYIENYGKMNFVEEVFDAETGNVIRKYSVNNDFNYLSVSGDITVEYKLCKTDWDDKVYMWVPDYEDNVVQTWKLQSKYKFDAKPTKYVLDPDFNDQVLKIYGADGDGEDVAKGIAYVDVQNVTAEKIEVSVNIINRDYDGGFSFDSFYRKNVVFNIKDWIYKETVLNNRDGDYISLILDADKGICVEKYDYEDNKKYHNEYIAY